MSAIRFTINGKEYNVNNLEANVSLNSFIRNHANLRGTKSMCQEGGCGACIVSVSAFHPVSNKPETFAVNSCLVSIMSCHDWAITTVEGIGNQKIGYHPVQTRLAGFNGTQCGYCSPGWVMNMYSLLSKENNNLTMKEVENSFAGNICRCTGYRPILDAFKSFSKDADPSLLQKVMDIEEISKVKTCAKSGLICTKSCGDYSSESDSCSINMERDACTIAKRVEKIQLASGDEKWYKVYTVADIFDIFSKIGNSSYMLLAGNTAQGIYRPSVNPKTIIDVSSVTDLRKYKVDKTLTLGGNMTLNEAMQVFAEHGQRDDNYKYLLQMYNHFDLIAHVPVRNIGTLAGNLMIKHEHNEFQSDVFILLEAVGAKIVIAEGVNKTKEITPCEFLKTNMKGKIIHSIILPPLSSNYVFHSYKIMPRAQNSHAHVNAAFLFKFNTDRTKVEHANIVFGGINPSFVHATAAELFVVNKNVFSNDTFKAILQKLNDEIEPDFAPPEPSPEYRKKLAIGLFYKFILNICPDATLNDRFKSGGNEFSRPVSKGSQEFDTNKDVWPLNQPIPKIEALLQCSGEAAFMNDLPTMPNEAYAAFVLSTIHNGIIDEIDATEVLKDKNAIAVFTAKDIPGKNDFAANLMLSPEIEEIVSSGQILFYGQPVAIVVATTEHLANAFAKKVKVTYKEKSCNPPVLTIRDALKSPTASERVIKNRTIEAKEKGNDVAKVIKGSFDIFGQYHYTMETQTCVCVPVEDGMDVYSACQYMDLVNAAVARAIDVPLNSINVKVRRLGGAYGGKISRSAQIAAACAVAAKILARPIRFVMSMESNMSAIGKRFPLSSDYEVGVDKNGKIQYLNNVFYQDNGSSRNESVAMFSIDIFMHSYNSSTWSAESSSVLTDTASNTWCRAPGTTEAVAMCENIMDHIAVEMNLDPTSVRLQNVIPDTPLPEIIETIKTSSDYGARLANVKKFNSANRWVKRGISLIPLNYPVGYWGNYTSSVSIYHYDGTVSICGAGIEMGQGLNTKIAQVCAHTLGISLDMVSVKPSNNFIAPNAPSTGGSIGSEVCAYATKRACEILLERLEPIKKEMENPTWQELVEKAHSVNVDLHAHHMFTTKDEVKPYVIWAASVIEVEVDMLTGNHQILRADILEDTGDSLSPLVDVGQVEGAYIMGLGYWTSEHLIYDKTTGQLLTNRSWNYKTPGVKDIPIDFRIQFRRNAPNPAGVLGSKATGEPPVNMAYGIIAAIRQAVTSFKKDQGLPEDQWHHIDIPFTPEHIVMAAGADLSDYKL